MNEIIIKEISKDLSITEKQVNTVLSLLSIFAILRVPMSPIYVMGLTAISIIELMVYINSYEKKEEN